MDACAYSIAYNVIYKIKLNDSINNINKIRVKETEF